MRVNACGAPQAPPLGALRINEVMSANDGAAVDEVGQAEDWIELRNDSAATIWLDAFMIRDAAGEYFELPHRELLPGERVVLWADDDESQGELHLPFKLSASGDAITIQDVNGDISDALTLPALQDNDSYARIPESAAGYSVCRYATPGRDNGERCGPPPPPDLTDVVTYSRFTWPNPLPHAPTQLSINELALRPAAFVELANVSGVAQPLGGVRLTIAPHKPGQPWPTTGDDVTQIELPDAVLEPGAHHVVPLTEAQVARLAADPLFEGVVTLWPAQGSAVLDRVDFMSWPMDAALSRQPSGIGHHAFCAATSPGEVNAVCEPLASREVGGRLRHLYTPGDFDALARGGTSLGIGSVKVVVDTLGGNAVHLLSAAEYDLHYTFVREVINGEPSLDRCVPEQDREFRIGWSAFSTAEYTRPEGGRYRLATLERYASGGQHVVHFLADSVLSLERMRDAFYMVVAHVQDATQWTMHPQSQTQAVAFRDLDGTVPLIGFNEPFRDQVLQPLTPAVGFGVLTFVASADLEQAALGPEVIVITDDVPNDIQLVGGLITEAFQTPLAHVNLLSRNRNTPNLALKDARHEPRIAPLLDKLVRFEVTADDFRVREATPEEAQAFWQSRRPTGPRIAPRMDTTLRGVQPLSLHDLASLPAIGAKAAQLAELKRVQGRQVRYYIDRVNTLITDCTGLIPTPRGAFAIPVVHGLEHFEQSGAKAIFEAEQAALADPTQRSDVLERMRNAIMSHPVEPTLLAQVMAEVQAQVGQERVRFRSSSNTEDLPEFNGAGLYNSLSAAIGDPERRIDDAMRTVWASLWLRRAYDEREQGNIDQSQVAMAILVHEAFPSERANGVGISRNILDPMRADQLYFNFQTGEASVTNPAPGVTTEQVVHTPWAPAGNIPELEYSGLSSLVEGQVLSLDEVRMVSCMLGAVHTHFAEKLYPGDAPPPPWFAMDVEVKLLGEQRSVMFKQARPYSFGDADLPADCRSL